MILKIRPDTAKIINEQGGRRGKAEFVDLCVLAWQQGNKLGILERMADDLMELRKKNG